MKKVGHGRILTYAVALFALFLWFAPILWMVLVSFKPPGTSVDNLGVLFAPPFTLENIMSVLESSQLWRWLGNSMLVSTITTAGIVVLTSMAAYALSALNFRGRSLVYWLVIAGMMVPIEAMIIPLYMMMNDMGQIDTYASLVLPGLAAPLGVILLKQFFDAIPKDLTDAARMDGAGAVRVYWEVYLPLSRSSMAALAIFTFLASWNSFLWPYLAIVSEEMMTLPIGVPLFQSGYSMELTRPMAANLLASLPVIIVFILFQRHIIKGVAMTGIK